MSDKKGCPVAGHYCRVCRPDLMPPDRPRIGEHHVSVRFSGDAKHIDVFIDGQKARAAFEALAGDPGVVWRYADHEHPEFWNGHPVKRLHCWAEDGAACVETVRGRVEVRSRLCQS